MPGFLLNRRPSVPQAITSFSPQAPLDELLALAQTKFPCDFERIKIGSLELDLLQLTDMEAYIDTLAQSATQSIELPFWARIWPTSILLATFLRNLPAAETTRVLELGAGVGLCGLVAARLGFAVTITDNNEDALLFSQINILRNGLSQRAGVELVDFTRTGLDRRFSLILGSEVLYHEETYRPLVKFLLRHIGSAPGSEVLLAKSYKLKAKRFFSLAARDFDIQEKVLGYKASESPSTPGEDRHLAQIYRLKPKKHA